MVSHEWEQLRHEETSLARSHLQGRGCCLWQASDARNGEGDCHAMVKNGNMGKNQKFVKIVKMKKW